MAAAPALPLAGRPFYCANCRAQLARIVGRGRGAMLLLESQSMWALIPGHTALTCRECGTVNQWRQRRAKEQQDP